MSIIVDRVNEYLTFKNLSVRQFEMSIGASNGSISRAIKEGKDIQAKWISKIVETYADISPNWLLKGIEPMLVGGYAEKQSNISNMLVSEPHAPYVITVGVDGVENIPFVNKKARAGYLSGYADPEYVEDLPAYRLPGFNNGTFRAFEVEGDSMYQFQTRSGLVPGAWVISEWVEHTSYIRDGRVYVIVSEDGVIIKRCINRLSAEEPVLICQSDNKSGEYPDILLYPEQICEVWEFKAAITRHIPPPGDVYKAVIDLQAEMAIVKHKLNML